MIVYALSVFLAAAQGLSSIADKTAGMTRLEGFFDLYWEESTGKLYWEIDSFDREFLYQSRSPPGWSNRRPRSAARTTLV
jgi:hypothetical protein